jgi:polyhydroxyalkanoate synthesis regulator protein
METTTTNETELIIRYSNRKLYSKVESKYLKLEEVGQRVVAGKFFKVIEKSSGKDITERTRLLGLASLQK